MKKTKCDKTRYRPTNWLICKCSYPAITGGVTVDNFRASFSLISLYSFMIFAALGFAFSLLRIGCM